MNFRPDFLFKPLSFCALKLNRSVRSAVPQPVVTGATLSRHDLRRLVAEMVD